MCQLLEEIDGAHRYEPVNVVDETRQLVDPIGRLFHNRPSSLGLRDGPAVTARQ